MQRAVTVVGLVLFFGFFFGLTQPRMGHSADALFWRSQARPSASTQTRLHGMSTLPNATGRLYRDTFMAWASLATSPRGSLAMLTALHAAAGGLLAGLCALAAMWLLKDEGSLAIAATLAVMGSFALWQVSTGMGPHIMAIGGCAAAFCLMSIDLDEPLGIRLGIAVALWAAAAALHGLAFWFLPVLVAMVCVSRPTVRSRRQRLAGLLAGAAIATAGIFVYETQVGASVEGRMGMGAWLVQRLDLRRPPGIIGAGQALLGFGRAVIHGGLLWERVRPGAAVAPIEKFLLIVPVTLVLGFALRLTMFVPNAVRNASRQDRRGAVALIVWVVASTLYAVVSRPSAPAAWAMALVPFWLLLAFPMRRHRTGLCEGDGRRLLFVMCSVLLAGINVAYDVAPLQRTVWARNVVPAGALRAAVQPGDLVVLARADEMNAVGPWMDAVALLPGPGDPAAVERFLKQCRETLGDGRAIVFSAGAAQAEGVGGLLMARLREVAEPVDVSLPCAEDSRPWRLAPVRRMRFYVAR